MRYFIRFVLLTIAFALTTWGLLTWAARDFSFAGFFDFSTFPLVHPIYVLVLGLALVPPTLWDIFELEQAPR